MVSVAPAHRSHWTVTFSEIPSPDCVPPKEPVTDPAMSVWPVSQPAKVALATASNWSKVGVPEYALVKMRLPG